MKSVCQAAWLLTVAFGNLFVSLLCIEFMSKSQNFDDSLAFIIADYCFGGGRQNR